MKWTTFELAASRIHVWSKLLYKPAQLFSNCAEMSLIYRDRPSIVRTAPHMISASFTHLRQNCASQKHWRKRKRGWRTWKRRRSRRDECGGRMRRRWRQISSWCVVSEMDIASSNYTESYFLDIKKKAHEKVSVINLSWSALQEWEVQQQIKSTQQSLRLL